ncbi:MAG: hypothetical protein IJO86_00030 [Oscillospiraceae bacterium]|nr:hypothetical protein [Oscillospiraceae bacterium]
MAENASNEYGSLAFKEAVCVDTDRIYDSCSDKDCLSDLRVLFPTDIQQNIIDNASSVKVKSVTVLNVLIDVENVPFNKGFYSVDMTYYFEVTCEVTTPMVPTQTVSGVATAQKKAILFGSEGNVRTFSTNSVTPINNNNNKPIARVQVVDPICLSSELVNSDEIITNPEVPDCICSYFKTNCFGRNADAPSPIPTQNQKDLYVTLGLFSIVQLERRAAMLIPCYDFCIPDKDCSYTPSVDSPCELFSKINFPTDEFFPPKLDIDSPNCCC